VSETAVGKEATVRTVLAAHAKLPMDAATIGVQADLYAAGLTSHASVNVMLALEDEFDIEFPDSMLRKSTFGSIAAITVAVQELTS
jgi:acyl carrier protein